MIETIPSGAQEQAVSLLEQYLPWIDLGWANSELLADVSAFLQLFAETEAGLLFLIGVIAQAAGGRVLVAAVGLAVASNLLNQFGIWTDQPFWIAPALAATVLIGFFHLALSLILGETGAAQAFVLIAGALLVLLLVKPMKFLRIPGVSPLSKATQKSKFKE